MIYFFSYNITNKQSNILSSCWAFSATGAMEAAWAAKTGDLLDLSEQNLVDCVNYGCDGGRMDWAFDYVTSNLGINDQSHYKVI